MDQTPSQHLPNVEPGHDGFTSPGVISQEKPQAALRKEMLINRDPLVGKRIDEGSFNRERRVNLGPEREPLPFRDNADNFRRSAEIRR